jgi:hypothetical protein
VRSCAQDLSVRRRSAGNSRPGCRGPCPAPAGGSPGRYGAVRVSGADKPSGLRPGRRASAEAYGGMVRASWRRCAAGSRRVRAARTAWPARGSGGDLAWRGRTVIWWRSTRISMFLTLPGRGSKASQPHSRVRIRCSRRKVTRADRAGVEVGPAAVRCCLRSVRVQESQVRCG